MSITIFFCYAREDEVLLNKLKSHLKPLQREGLIAVWHDRDISAGSVWEHEIKQHLNAAQIILLLISPDFMQSDYCYGIEMQRALERHANGEAKVIPVILRPVYWGIKPLRALQALPTDGEPVTSPLWHDLDTAFYDITEGIYKVAEQLIAPPASALPVVAEVTQQQTAQASNIPLPVQQSREDQLQRSQQEQSSSSPNLTSVGKEPAQDANSLTSSDSSVAPSPSHQTTVPADRVHLSHQGLSLSYLHLNERTDSTKQPALDKTDLGEQASSLHTRRFSRRLFMGGEGASRDSIRRKYPLVGRNSSSSNSFN